MSSRRCSDVEEMDVEQFQVKRPAKVSPPSVSRPAPVVTWSVQGGTIVREGGRMRIRIRGNQIDFPVYEALSIAAAVEMAAEWEDDEQ